MEQKKSLKVSFSTCLFIIAMIAILIMSFLIYRIYVEKNQLSQQISDLKEELDVSLAKQDSTTNVISPNVENSLSKQETSNLETPDISYSTESNALKIATDLYEKAYQLLRSDDVKVSGNYTVDGKSSFGYKINFTKLETVFSPKVISQFKNSLLEEKGSYYDLLDSNGTGTTFLGSLDVTSIFSNVDSGIRPLSLVTYNDNYIVAMGQLPPSEHTTGDDVPLYLILKKENGNWLIDLFE